MFIVLLRFAAGKARASEFMAAHKSWLNTGFEEGVFILAGSLKPQNGGAILAQQTSLEALQARVAADPFVQHGVVSAEILEVAPSRSVESLAFLCG